MDMKKFKECLNEIYDNEVPVRLSEDRLAELSAQISKEKPKRNFGLKLAGFATSLACFITCIVLPITLNKPDKFYGENDVEQEEVDNTYFLDFLDTNYPQYSFIQDECEIENVYGYYSNDNHTLLALSSDLNKIEIPYTTIEFNLVMTNNYTYKNHTFYLANADIIKYDNYTMYKKINKNESNETVYILLEYSNYKLYLQSNINDEKFLEKFL